ncbi:phage virion morphogenesis protein [Idiomarina abyssalis]|uniref:phage virion morphogenesis protein n=1 Tax=Idiomarina abyssalis TaxID=86102 RepID=UPI001CD2404B|nr:phage virion morphogenesis protein [Idiomarina abyssalis]
MADGVLDPFVDRVQALLEKLDTGQRKALARDISRHLRGSQAKRIRENENPDGSPYEDRKPQPEMRKRKGSLRMFRKIHRTKNLKAKATPNEASVGFTGFANHIARVNQYGLRARVNERGLQHKYPERELLGLTDKDRDFIEETMVKHVDDALNGG